MLFRRIAEFHLFAVAGFFASIANAADTPANTSTNVTLSLSRSVAGQFERPGDVDWLKVQLVKGKRYKFGFTASGLTPSRLQIIDGTGASVLARSNSYEVDYLAKISGIHFLSARAPSDGITGSYSAVMLFDAEAPDTSSPAKAIVGKPKHGKAEGPDIGNCGIDDDWIGIQLQANRQYFTRVSSPGSEFETNMRDKLGRLLSLNRRQNVGRSEFMCYSASVEGLYFVQMNVVDACNADYEIYVDLGCPLGTAESEIINGTSAADIILALAGDDTINGLEGDDFIDGGTGDDLINGGGGIDTADYSSRLGPVTVDLSANPSSVEVVEGLLVERDTLISIEAVIGSNAGDNIVGNAKSNRIVGLAGTDRLTGKEGNDVFVFNSTSDGATGTARDKITDFVTGVDRIDLSGIDANETKSGNQPFELLTVGGSAFTGVGQIRWYFGGPNFILVELNTQGDKSPELQIALFTNKALVDRDFVK